MNKSDIHLYAILDPEHCKGRPLVHMAKAAAEGGATLVQYRDKTSPVREMIANAKEIKSAIEGSGIRLIVNDRVDVALASNADGVHLGQDDMRVDDARRLVGPDAIIGISIKTVEEAKACPVDVIDYAFVGGVFETRSKDNPAAIGIDGWVERANIIRNASPGLPVGAIAGIDESNIASLMEAGCDGVAIISAIFMANDVAKATASLSRLVKNAGEKVVS